MNIVIHLIVSQNYIPLPMILLGMFHTLKQKQKKILYLFRHVERSHDIRKIFGVLLKDGKSVQHI
jgi:hypothetical protein